MEFNNSYTIKSSVLDLVDREFLAVAFLFFIEIKISSKPAASDNFHQLIIFQRIIQRSLGNLYDSLQTVDFLVGFLFFYTGNLHSETQNFLIFLSLALDKHKAASDFNLHHYIKPPWFFLHASILNYSACSICLRKLDHGVQSTSSNYILILTHPLFPIITRRVHHKWIH